MTIADNGHFSLKSDKFRADTGPMHPDGVVGHVLLNWLSTIAGRAATMRHNWDDLPVETRVKWLADMERTAIEAAQLCERMARGFAPELPAEVATEPVTPA